MTNREKVIVGLLVLFGGLVLTGCAVQVKAPPELESAILSADHDTVKSILEEDPKLANARIHGDIPLLHLAVRHKDIAEFLIANGADVNAKNDSGDTALYRALNAYRYIPGPDKKVGGGFEMECGEDYEETAKFLISKGADVKLGSDSRSALSGAVECGYTEIVALVIAKGANPNINATAYGTPLNCAVAKGYPEITRLLVAGRANVNAKNVDYTPYERNCTALHSAVGRGRKDIAEFLIAAGADVNAKCDYSTSSEQAFVESFPLDRRISLMIFSLFRHEDTNWWFPSKGQPSLITPLHLAALNGDKELAELLIANGADVNAKDKGGKTPLDLVRDKELAEVLRKHGAVK